MEKYSEFSIELDVQDERRYDSAVHYGMRSISDDGNYSAGMFVHADSCNNEILSRYYLSCYDEIREELTMANTKERVLSSLEHERFCIVPLDSWHQAVYDYGKVISEQTKNHFQKAETMSNDFETVMKFQNELERFSALSDIMNFMYQDEPLNTIEKSIQEYNVKYGFIPDKLQKLIDARPAE
jgi:RNase adaptor protein for sRNA GlmZ degradation